MNVRVRLTITGVVQGVGFRPHVHRLAVERELAGYVGNDSASVFVEIEGPPDDVAWVSAHIVVDAPPLSRIESVETEPIDPTGAVGFEIVASRSVAGARTLVSPDVAVCDDCRDELLDPADHRYRYPFITCTNCGPRFTIIRRLPYDRPNTTMAEFVMCAVCAGEYNDPTDRRFHAQPLACSACGPQLTYRSQATTLVGTDRDSSDAVIAAVQRNLADGLVVAIKGIGGYHLTCDATNDAAVERLRMRKGRADKPFAVMVDDLETACAVALIDDVETAAITSPPRPIVLLRSRGSDALRISPLAAPGNPHLGVMLAYAPLHHLLFRPVPGHEAVVPRALVMTSGNRSNEPLAYDDDDALLRLADLADSFCTHDRPIHVPCDDSVLRIVDGSELPIRRSRGYAPLPVRLPMSVPPTLAVGGELKNVFCIADGEHAWMSQHIGDMGNIETLRAFEASVELFCEMYDVEPANFAADAHPDYMTSRWAAERSSDPSLVQHHHAHVCALMAEHSIPSADAVIGVAFDGTGYGIDGAIWGGEVLVADYAGFERVAALADIALPGGDAAIRKPYRVALSYLRSVGIEWRESLLPVAVCSPSERAALASMFDSGTGCVPTSSMGRLFDAVSSLLGVRHEISFEGQAAMELEHLAAAVSSPPERRQLRFVLDDDSLDGTSRIGVASVLAGLVDGLAAGESVPSLAAAFHDATAAMIVMVAERVRDRTGIRIVGLTGGVFQNALLVESARCGLESAGFRVLLHRVVPPNDGGLALGQAIASAASARREPAGHGGGDEDDVRRSHEQ